MATPLPAGLRNSHQNGGRVFLIFVADPRTVRLCKIGLIHPPAAQYSTEATAVLVFSGVPSIAGEVDTAAERQRVIDDRDFL